jgi:mono/diheme cytochrome c family protein
VLAAGALLAVASGCSREARTIGPEQPQTPPSGAQDPRATAFQGNVYQVAQGGRYFTWYGCGRCHGVDATGVRDLADGRWKYGGTIDRVFAVTANGHGGGDRVPTEQVWQIAAFVRDLHSHTPGKRHRQDNDLKGEPQGAAWSGPLR